MKKLDAEMKKTDLLLYQMIPKKIADRLRSGEKAANLCEVCIRNIEALSIEEYFIVNSNNQYDENANRYELLLFFRHSKVVQFYSVMLWVLHQYVQHLHQWKWCQYLMKCIRNLTNL
jgi:hypothetical protein